MTTSAALVTLLDSLQNHDLERAYVSLEKLYEARAGTTKEVQTAAAVVRALFLKS